MVVSKPANDKYIALFLISLLQTDKSYNVIQSVVCAVKWAHGIEGLVDPTSQFSKNILECAKRTAKTKRTPKEPLIADMIKLMYVRIGGEKASLLELRKFCILLLSYVGFLRFDEVSNLVKGDISFYHTHMSIFIEKSKTDVYRDGHTLVISRLESECCPVRVLGNYISKGNIVEDGAFLFRATTWWKILGVYTLRTANKPMSYSTARLDALELIGSLGVDPKKIGLHSARSGGATSAANNGIPDRLFKGALRGTVVGYQTEPKTAM